MVALVEIVGVGAALIAVFEVGIRIGRNEAMTKKNRKMINDMKQEFREIWKNQKG